MLLVESVHIYFGEKSSIEFQHKDLFFKKKICNWNFLLVNKNVHVFIEVVFVCAFFVNILIQNNKYTL